MPNYEILINGKPRKVEISKTGQDSFTAKIDDKLHSVELRATKLDFEKGFEIEVDAKTYKIELPKIERGKPIPVKVEEAIFKADVSNSRMHMTTTPQLEPQTPARKAFATKQTTTAVEGAITAPMTGKIISVKVKKSDQVEPDQVLCIIEAMKMENEITATKAGIIREVNVSEGSPVNEGDTLFVIG